MRNRPSEPRRSISENQIACLQRYIVLGYERKRRYSKFKINNIVLQIILREYNFDFHQRNRDIQFPSFSRPKTKNGSFCPDAVIVVRAVVAGFSSRWI
jgi:hypothetical protein